MNILFLNNYVLADVPVNILIHEFSLNNELKIDRS